MTLADTLLPEPDHEMATTRTLLALEREADAEWKPHPKSWSLLILTCYFDAPSASARPWSAP